MTLGIPYDSTDYIQDAIDEVLHTLVGDAAHRHHRHLPVPRLVPRRSLIPIVAIPISLIGAVFLMLVAGFTINLLTLLAIVLSVGLVVDDAIVIVENVERHLQLGRDAVRRRDRARRASSSARSSR